MHFEFLKYILLIRSESRENDNHNGKVHLREARLLHTEEWNNIF